MDVNAAVGEEKHTEVKKIKKKIRKKPNDNSIDNSILDYIYFTCEEEDINTFCSFNEEHEVIEKEKRKNRHLYNFTYNFKYDEFKQLQFQQFENETDKDLYGSTKAMTADDEWTKKNTAENEKEKEKNRKYEKNREQQQKKLSEECFSFLIQNEHIQNDEQSCCNISYLYKSFLYFCDLCYNDYKKNSSIFVKNFERDIFSYDLGKKKRKRKRKRQRQRQLHELNKNDIASFLNGKNYLLGQKTLHSNNYDEILLKKKSTVERIQTQTQTNTSTNTETQTDLKEINHNKKVKKNSTIEHTCNNERNEDTLIPAISVVPYIGYSKLQNELFDYFIINLNFEKVIYFKKHLEGETNKNVNFVLSDAYRRETKTEKQIEPELNKNKKERPNTEKEIKKYIYKPKETKKIIKRSNSLKKTQIETQQIGNANYTLPYDVDSRYSKAAYVTAGSSEGFLSVSKKLPNKNKMKDRKYKMENWNSPFLTNYENDIQQIAKDITQICQQKKKNVLIWNTTEKKQIKAGNKKRDIFTDNIHDNYIVNEKKPNENTHFVDLRRDSANSVTQSINQNLGIPNYHRSWSYFTQRDVTANNDEFKEITKKDKHISIIADFCKNYISGKEQEQTLLNTYDRKGKQDMQQVREKENDNKQEGVEGKKEKKEYIKNNWTEQEGNRKSSFKEKWCHGASSMIYQSGGEKKKENNHGILERNKNENPYEGTFKKQKIIKRCFSTIIERQCNIEDEINWSTTKLVGNRETNKMKKEHFPTDTTGVVHSGHMWTEKEKYCNQEKTEIGKEFKKRAKTAVLLEDVTRCYKTESLGQIPNYIMSIGGSMREILKKQILKGINEKNYDPFHVEHIIKHQYGKHDMLENKNVKRKSQNNKNPFCKLDMKNNTNNTATVKENICKKENDYVQSTKNVSETPSSSKGQVLLVSNIDLLKFRFYALYINGKYSIIELLYKYEYIFFDFSLTVLFIKALIKLKKYEKCIKYIIDINEESSSLSHKYSVLYYFSGICYKKLKKYKISQNLFSKAIVHKILKKDQMRTVPKQDEEQNSIFEHNVYYEEQLETLPIIFVCLDKLIGTNQLRSTEEAILLNYVKLYFDSNKYINYYMDLTETDNYSILVSVKKELKRKIKKKMRRKQKKQLIDKKEQNEPIKDSTCTNWRTFKTCSQNESFGKSERSKTLGNFSFLKSDVTKAKKNNRNTYNESLTKSKSANIQLRNEINIPQTKEKKNSPFLYTENFYTPNHCTTIYQKEKYITPCIDNDFTQKGRRHKKKHKYSLQKYFSIIYTSTENDDMIAGKDDEYLSSSASYRSSLLTETEKKNREKTTSEHILWYFDKIIKRKWVKLHSLNINDFFLYIFNEYFITHNSKFLKRIKHFVSNSFEVKPVIHLINKTCRKTYLTWLHNIIESEREWESESESQSESESEWEWEWEKEEARKNKNDSYYGKVKEYFEKERRENRQGGKNEENEEVTYDGHSNKLVDAHVIRTKKETVTLMELMLIHSYFFKTYDFLNAYFIGNYIINWTKKMEEQTVILHILSVTSINEVFKNKKLKIKEIIALYNKRMHKKQIENRKYYYTPKLYIYHKDYLDYFTIGVIYYLKNNFKKSYIYFMRCVNLRNEFYFSFIFAFYLSLLKNHSDKRLLFYRCLSLEPYNILPYLIYSSYLITSFQKITKEKKALHLDKEFFFTKNRRDSSYDDTYLSYIYTTINKAIYLDKENPFIYNELFVYYFLKKEFTQCTNIINEVFQTNPIFNSNTMHIQTIWYNIAVFYFYQKDIETAEKCLINILYKNPYELKSLHLLTTILYIQKREMWSSFFDYSVSIEIAFFTKQKKERKKSIQHIFLHNLKQTHNLGIIIKYYKTIKKKYIYYICTKYIDQSYHSLFLKP